MRLLICTFLFLKFTATLNAQIDTEIKKKPAKIALALHGGASNITNLHLSKEQDSAYRYHLNAALNIGYKILKSGGKSIDAVEAVVIYLEDNPLFNAGKGSVLTNEGTIEMDACIMDGSQIKYGSVCTVKSIKNPIRAARLVLDSSKQVILSGSGAEKFAEIHGLELLPQSYFETEFRRNQLNTLKNKDTSMLDNDRGYIPPINELKDEKFGTVGAVAIDQFGNLAAATSTGGVVNKKFNRIGDSPIGGAGTYSNNSTCAVSCTGRGEEFLRLLTAFDISCMMEYQKISLKKSVKKAIQKKLVSIKGRGGCIAVDKNANISIEFTTTGMFRASIDKYGKRFVGIYQNE
jgi:beta-aspartyl-peptidase (threonine type)